MEDLEEKKQEEVLEVETPTPEPAVEPIAEPAPVIEETVPEPETMKPVPEPAPAPEPKPAPAPEPKNNAPLLKLDTNRGLIKFWLLSMITFGIYALIVMMRVGDDVNTVASPHDGRKSMNFILMSILSGFTGGIVSLIWFHNLSDRIGIELKRRGIDYSFSAGTFWGWDILGSMIFIGPVIYSYKLFKAMNLMNADYNAKG